MSLPRKSLNVNERFDTYTIDRDFLVECRRCGHREMARLYWNGQEYATTCIADSKILPGSQCCGTMVQAS